MFTCPICGFDKLEKPLWDESDGFQNILFVVVVVLNHGLMTMIEDLQLKNIEKNGLKMEQSGLLQNPSNVIIVI